MLVNDDRVLQMAIYNPMLMIMNPMGFNRRIAVGIYEVCHFGCSPFLPELKDFRNTGEWGLKGISSYYGVCDTYQQIIDKEPTLQDPDRKFFITLKSVKKSEQPESGGWRWHKWGEYIGIQEPSGCEYLYDEPLIEEVFVYHIYEKM